jgi:hypothetical protein
MAGAGEIQVGMEVNASAGSVDTMEFVGTGNRPVSLGAGADEFPLHASAATSSVSADKAIKDLRQFRITAAASPPGRSAES